MDPRSQQSLDDEKIVKEPSIAGHTSVIEAGDTFTEAEARKVVRKIDRWVLPVMWILFTLNFMDKQALNYGAVWGLKKDLKLSTSEYAWCGSIFYFGYLLANFLFPPIVAKVPVAKFCAVIIVCWSIILMCMPACKSFAGLAANRFFLGLAEGGITPAFVVLTSMLYTREEQTLRSCVWYTGNAFGNVFGGMLGYAFGEAHTSLSKWMLFPLVFGAISLGFSVLFWYIIPDRADSARFLNDREREVAVARVQANHTGINRHGFSWPQFWEAMTDVKTWCILIIALPNALQASGPGTFGSQIVKNFGFNTLDATILQGVPTGGFQAVITLLIGWIASRYKGYRLILMAACNVPSIVGGACLYTFPKTNKALFAAYVCVYTATATQALYLSFISSNFGGYTKKTVVATLSLIMYSAGQIAGPHFFTNSPYNLGFGMMMCCYAIIIVVSGILYIYCARENRRRDGLTNTDASLEEKEGDVLDLTDKQREATFRYTF